MHRVHTHTCTQGTHARIHAHTCTNAHIVTHVHTCAHTGTHRNTCTRGHTRAHTCMYMQAHAHARALVCTLAWRALLNAGAGANGVAAVTVACLSWRERTLFPAETPELAGRTLPLCLHPAGSAAPIGPPAASSLPDHTPPEGGFPSAWTGAAGSTVMHWTEVARSPEVCWRVAAPHCFLR